MLLTLPPVGNKIVRSGKTCLAAAVVHGIIFAVLLRWLDISDGFQDGTTADQAAKVTIGLKAAPPAKVASPVASSKDYYTARCSASADDTKRLNHEYRRLSTELTSINKVGIDITQNARLPAQNAIYSIREQHMSNQNIQCPITKVIGSDGKDITNQSTVICFNNTARKGSVTIKDENLIEVQMSLFGKSFTADPKNCKLS
jgi:hypothetical protein